MITNDVICYSECILRFNKFSRLIFGRLAIRWDPNLIRLVELRSLYGSGFDGDATDFKSKIMEVHYFLL